MYIGIVYIIITSFLADLRALLGGQEELTTYPCPFGFPLDIQHPAIKGNQWKEAPFKKHARTHTHTPKLGGGGGATTQQALVGIWGCSSGIP